MIKGNEAENKNKKTKEVAKNKAENITHGSRLLEKEFRRQEATNKIIKSRFVK